MAVLYGVPLIIGAQKVLGFNVFAASQTPAEGKPGDICLITDSMGTALISPVEPSVKTEGDVWIVTGDTGGVEITVGEGTLNTVRLLGAQQWDGAAWKKLDGYVWNKSQWMKFSKKYELIGKLPILSKIKYNEFDFTIISHNHNGYPQDSTSLFFENWGSGIWGFPPYISSDLKTATQNKFNSFSELFQSKILETDIYVLSNDKTEQIKEKMFPPGAGEVNIDGRISITGQNLIEALTARELGYLTRDCKGTYPYSAGLSLGVFYNFSSSYYSSILNISNYELVSPEPNLDGSYNLIL